MSSRLSSWLIGGIGILLVIAGLVLDTTACHQAQQSYDDALLAKARALVTLTEQDEDGIELEFADEFMPEFVDPSAPSYFQIRLANGDVLERSRSLGEQDLNGFDDIGREPHFIDALLPDGRSGRWVGLKFAVQLDEDIHGTVDQQSASIIVAEERERLDGVIASIHTTLILTGIIIISCVLLIRHVAGAGLRPIMRLQEQVAVLDDRSLDSRLTWDQPAEELEGLVDQFNALLSRLQTAFSREKQFTADVAHELRTPLAELRNLAEVGGRWPDDQKLVREFFGDVIEATAQMERIVVNLLALANGETCDISKIKEKFDLVLMLEEVWASRREGAMKRRLTFDYTGLERLCIDSARDPWFLILSNLFDNAVSYGLDDGEIACTIDCEQQHLILRLTNAQHDLVEQDLDHLFDRCWRKGPARTGSQHAGLGLTLVKAYADQLGLTVEARLAEPDIFEISLRGQVEGVPDAPCECSAHRARTTEEGPGSLNSHAPA